MNETLDTRLYVLELLYTRHQTNRKQTIDTRHQTLCTRYYLCTRLCKPNTRPLALDMYYFYALDTAIQHNTAGPMVRPNCRTNLGSRQSAVTSQAGYEKISGKTRKTSQQESLQSALIVRLLSSLALHQTELQHFVSKY